ncbi:hypothetical protein PR202_gb20974 [Eleusine coracana subsp. coracana]|uniref:Protein DETOXIFICATION n=1 Tax=Eleusine coracana subsp. coracana TaxID=191504 RepID=A0AAV5FDW7_ELECO|nr:hypothetical protein PR202_gb20974 [Eleusine coracana subsp. coracana]
MIFISINVTHYLKKKSTNVTNYLLCFNLSPNSKYFHLDSQCSRTNSMIVCTQLGMGSAVETLCGQAYGAHKHSMLGVYMQRSTVLLMATGIPLAVLYAFSERVLVLLGESERIAAAAAFFVYGLIPQIFAYAANFPIQKFLQAQSIVAPSAYISAATLVLHLALSWVAVYKMGLGLLGGSLVLSLSWWVIVVAQFAYIVTSPRCRETWTGFTVQAFSGLCGFFKLSAASAVMLCLETWYFQILVLIAGLLKNPELSLDSLSICMTVNGWVFMISVGFNAAASVRVGNELGAGNPRAAAFSVVVVTSLSLAVAVVCAVVVLCLRDQLSYFFTGGEAVARAVSDLCPLLAVTLILNGVQPVLSGVAVGCGWQAFVAYVNVGCYYIVGVPLGVFLGFYLDFGAKGVWSGMVIGGTMTQTLILLWVTFRTDWNKEVAYSMHATIIIVVPISRILDYCPTLILWFRPITQIEMFAKVEKAKARLDKWEDKKQSLLED